MYLVLYSSSSTVNINTNKILTDKMVSIAVRKLRTLSTHYLCKISFSTNLLRDLTTRNCVLNSKNHLFKMSQNKFGKSASNTLLPANRDDNIVWVDMEMTGLDPENDHVLEVACLVTDSNLNVIAEGPDIAIRQPKEVLTSMNEWSIKQHGESGLTDNCTTSTISLRDAERQLLDFVREWAPFKRCPLGGNTIYMDRMFLMKHMPEFEQHMHYRIIDVSSVKELCRRWRPEIYTKQPNKKELSLHRAMSDIKNSVEELKFYKKHIFDRNKL